MMRTLGFRLLLSVQERFCFLSVRASGAIRPVKRSLPSVASPQVAVWWDTWLVLKINCCQVYRSVFVFCSVRASGEITTRHWRGSFFHQLRVHRSYSDEATGNVYAVKYSRCRRQKFQDFSVWPSRKDINTGRTIPQVVLDEMRFSLFTFHWCERIEMIIV